MPFLSDVVDAAFRLSFARLARIAQNNRYHSGASAALDSGTASSTPRLRRHVFALFQAGELVRLGSLVLILGLCGLQVGCGGGSGKSKAPSGLAYPQSSIVATVGTAIATDTPTVTGTVTSYAVSPALPAGLSLSASTGAISGTPTAASAKASYTVTASNASGSATATIQITVNAATPPAPSNLQYPQTSIVATVGTSITTDTPTVTGTVTSYKVSPALPAGLSLSASTGAISGTPTAASAQASYTVTASNASGSTTATVQITVNAAVTGSAPANLSYTTATIAAINGEAITADKATVTGTVTSWSVAPQLPAGLSLNASTGTISGTPTQVAASSSYTVTAANAGGSTTASVQIGVVAATVNQAVHATFVSGHQSFHAALNYTYSALNFALPGSSPIKESLTRALRSRLQAVHSGPQPIAQDTPDLSYNADLGLYQTDMIQNGSIAAINYYLDAAGTKPAGATTLTFPNGVTAGNYTSANYPLTLPITQNVTAGKIPTVGSGTIVLLDSTGKNTIQGSLALTAIGLTVNANISLDVDNNLNVTGSGSIVENGETITVSNMSGPFSGDIAGGAVLTPQNYSGTANISIPNATFSAIFTTPNGVGTCSSANGVLLIQYPDGSTETLNDPNSTQPNAPPSTSTSGPSRLNYAVPAISATVGEVIVNDTPTLTGTATAWNVNPALPAGLTIDGASGIISGTPSEVSAATTYVVTASNADGFTQGTIQITVAAPPAPSGLSYAQSVINATVGTAIPSDEPSVTGTVTSWSVSPALPAGLSLNSSTGVISGTPTAAAAQANYTITAANASGSTTATVQITVTAASSGPVSVTYPVTSITAYEDQAITPDVPVLTGTVSGFYMYPALPYGITIDPNTGTISGTPISQMPATSFTVYASQTDGPAATVQITVQEAPVQGIAAQDAVFTGSTLNLASFASATAQSWDWSLVNQSSGGTITAGSSTDLIQYKVTTTPGTYQLNVTTKAASGNPTTATRTLHVVNQQFLKDPTSSWDRGIPSASQLANGSILFVGGQSASPTAQYSSEVYDPVSKTFSTTAGLKVMHTTGQAQVTLSNGKVLLCGGLTSASGQEPQISADAEIYDPAADTWTTAASMNTGRSWHTATLLQNGKVLVTGGEDGNGSVSSSVEIYDPASDTWTVAADMNTARNQHTALLLSDGTVMVVGGSTLPYNASGQVSGAAAAEIYDPTANTWTTVGSLQTPRIANTATLLSGGKVLVTGGTDSSLSTLSSAELYDPAKKTWSYAAAMNTAVFSASATLLANGTVLVTGGETGQNATPSAAAEIYDPTANTWTTAASMNTPRYSPFASLLANGDVLVAYGACLGFTLDNCGVFGAGYTQSAGAAEIYNVAKNTWTPVGMAMQLPGYVGNSTFNPGLAAALLADGQVLLTGGGSGTGSGPANTAQLFNPATNAWTLAAPMNTARANHTETVLQDGKVLVTGGDLQQGPYVDYSFVLNSAEIYDPTTNTWTAAANLITGRTQHTATLLANGKVLIAGGLDGSGNLIAAAELYDPAANTWTAAGSLTTPRYLHTATLLKSGKVLLAGGASTGGVPTNTAELYDPSANSWSAAATMPDAEQSHTATLLSDGTVMVVGAPFGRVALYNPTANTWSQLASTNAYRTQHAATLLSTGQVLVTGGTEDDALVSQCEIYTPSTNTWTLIAPLNLPRFAHFALQLSDGRVMIVGGTPGYIPEFWKQ